MEVLVQVFDEEHNPLLGERFEYDLQDLTQLEWGAYWEADDDRWYRLVQVRKDSGLVKVDLLVHEAFCSLH